jgi:uncharacterized protein
MFIAVLELEREPIEFDHTIAAGAIDYGSEIRQLNEMPVEGRAELILEHRGSRQAIQDIRVRAQYRGRFQVRCARCLEAVEHTLSDRMDLLFRPSGADAGSSEHAISTSDTEIGYYRDGGLALEDVVREQVLLSMPARSLCRQDCKGLCPGCGRNLNQETCACGSAPSDPRWNALVDFCSKLKT